MLACKCEPTHHAPRVAIGSEKMKKRKTAAPGGSPAVGGKHIPRGAAPAAQSIHNANAHLGQAAKRHQSCCICI
eukprot:375901-Prymnesium_polylepis.1